VEVEEEDEAMHATSFLPLVNTGRPPISRTI